MRVNVGFNYLNQTLESLIQSTHGNDFLQVTVVIFLADFDERSRLEIKIFLCRWYHSYLIMGFIQILEVDSSVYPPLDNIQRRFDDPPIRVKWRSKQVVDYSILFYYSQNMSDYYLHLEDDVITAEMWLRRVKRFIDRQGNRHWIVLRLSSLGFIGKLFKNSDLNDIAKFMYHFYSEQPADWLYGYYSEMIIGKRYLPIIHPTLFQHIGDKSSLVIKPISSLRDKGFRMIYGEKMVVHNHTVLKEEKHIFSQRQIVSGSGEAYVEVNPPALLYTNMKPYTDKYSPQEAYDKNTSFFWAWPPIRGQTLSIIFIQPQKLNKVIIVSGHPQYKNDYLSFGTVTCCPAGSLTDWEKCTCYRRAFVVGQFYQGTFNITELDNKISHYVQCLNILITDDQVEWLVIQSILVYINRYNTVTRVSHPIIPTLNSSQIASTEDRITTMSQDNFNKTFRN